MTELLSKEFSRRSFLKGGGALIVGFGVAAAAGGKAHAQESPYASNGPPDHYQVDSWIAIHADNTASVKSGAILQGTGSETGILMIAAEELDMDLAQVKHVHAETNLVPQTGAKVASNTIVHAGPGVRAAAAHARLALLDLASKQLGVPTTSLTVSKGVVSGGGRSVTYGQLIGDKLLNVRMPASYAMESRNTGPFGFTGGLRAGQSPAKPVDAYKVVGTRAPRIDIPGIVTGTMDFIQNVRLPGMLHGRLVRPRGQALYGFGAPVVSVDERSIRHISGARVVRVKDFLAVVAPEEYTAIQAAAQLKVTWADPPKALPGHGNEFQGLRALDTAGKTVHLSSNLNGVRDNGDVGRALATAAHVVSASFGWPTNVHTPIGVSCAVADATPQGIRIFSGTQGVYKTREFVADALRVPLTRVRVTAVPMGGCFGNGMQYRDTALAATLLSQAVGVPVRVQLMRWDEIGWDNVAPGTLMDIRAGIDAGGNLVGFDETQFYPQYISETVETTGELTGTPSNPTAVSGNYSATPSYNVPANRYVLKSVPLKGNWIKADWFRAGNSVLATFAGEQVIDELARRAKMDPVAFRVQNVTRGPMRDPLLAVLNAATAAAKWEPRVTASKLSDASVVSGRGIAWGNVDKIGVPTAVIADVQVDKKTGKISVKHVYHAFSGGLSVYPGGVENQIVGGTVQIIGRLLTEQLRFSKASVTSGDFVTYPMLRFNDAPKVTAILLQRKDAQPDYIGEPVATTAAAAVANAFFDATGVRMLTAPMTPARVRAALKA
jgi:CO/xanthine dehydrogenase Mo-binding subunit